MRGKAKKAAVRARYPTTQRQRDIMDFYRTFHERSGYWPTFAEAVQGMGFSSNEAIAGHVRRLIAKGYMARGARGKSRSITVVQDPGDLCCPACGRAFEPKKTVRGVR